MNLSRPRIFGTPSSKAEIILKSRDEFLGALRSDDQKMLSGMRDSDDNDSSFGMMGYASLFPGFETHKFAGYSSYIEAGTKKVWASARAVDIIANVILSTEMKLAWRDPEKNKKRIAVKPDANLVRLLQNPNPYDTISEMLYLWVHHLKFTGNAFWFKDEMNGFGQPKNIYALNPAFVRIVPDKKTRVAKYTYRINSTQIEFTPEEIIHFKRPNAGDPLFGLGDVEQGESLFQEFINRALFNERFMANGAFPSTVLVKENFEGEQGDWDRFTAAFREKYGGVKNSGKTAMLSGKWSLLQLGITAQQMQEMEKNTKNVNDIFTNHGVPLSVAGIERAANYATAQQDDRNFRKNTCLPLVNWFVDAMNSPRGLLPAFTKDLKLDFALSGLIDMEQVMKEQGPLFDRGGLSINELRQAMGYQPTSDPHHDQHYIQAGYVPLEIAGATQPTEEDIQRVSNPKPQGGDRNTADGEPAEGKERRPGKGADNLLAA